MAEPVVQQAVEDIVAEIPHFVKSTPNLWEITTPSLERPFGIQLYPLFREAILKVAGKDVDRFEYKFNSDVPMSSVPAVSAAIVLYYVVIFGGQFLLKSVRPIRLNPIFKLHNLILTLLSLTLLLLLTEQLVPIVGKHGVFYGICNPNSWTQRIELLYYLNYLTKFYELLDTVFLVLRHRPLTFLHTYHHGATALLCFSQLNGRTSVSWVPITLNLGVHVVMYFYYFLSACGIRPWWKHWVTRFQIIQFIIDLGFVYFASYTYFVSKYWPWLPNNGTCAGEEAAALNGCLILTSYLVLFISFYIKVYLTPKSKKAVKREAVAAEQIDSATATGSSKTKSKSRRTV